MFHRSPKVCFGASRGLPSRLNTSARSYTEALAAATALARVRVVEAHAPGQPFLYHIERRTLQIRHVREYYAEEAETILRPARERLQQAGFEPNRAVRNWPSGQ